MATPASIRLPIRSIIRLSTHSSPAATIRKAQCCINASTPAQSRRYASNETDKKGDKSSDATSLPSWRVKNDTVIERILSKEEVEEKEYMETGPRLPRAVQAVYLRPLRREAQYGVPSCDLQLRSYSVRNLEFFADFALRAAYYLNLPAYGPVPLPRIVERWTIPRGHFVHKKSQENYERKTLRRLIQIKDGNDETVGLWLAFLRKHAYYGIGMKANVWSFDKLGVGKNMDEQMEALTDELKPTLENFAFKQGSEVARKAIEVINRENFRAATGAGTPMMEKRQYEEE